MKLLIAISFLFANILHAADATLVLEITGDSGSSISELNQKLEEQGIDERLPSEIRITSTMTMQDVSILTSKMDNLIDMASPYEAMETSAMGIEDDMLLCFEGDQREVPGIYENMVDSILSDQFYIIAVAYQNENHVGIKYDQSDSGTDGAWLNIKHCN